MIVEFFEKLHDLIWQADSVKTVQEVIKREPEGKEPRVYELIGIIKGKCLRLVAEKAKEEEEIFRRIKRLEDELFRKTGYLQAIERIIEEKEKTITEQNK